MRKKLDKKIGLNQKNINFIVSIFFLCLLMWGPVQPYGLLIRITYLIALPTLLYFGLGYFGKMWKADNSANNRLTCGIAGIIAGAFFVLAGLAFTADYHSECDQEINTRDGKECVGDYVTSKGPDTGKGITLIILGSLAAWYAVTKHKDEKEIKN